MFIEELNRHLAIASREEATALLRAERRFWNVVSIYSAITFRATLSHARKAHYACFDDTEEETPAEFNQPATADDLAQIFRFVDATRLEPLLIHCEAGLSRSPAVALALMCRRLLGRKDFVTRAVDLLLQVRPIARPNQLVLRLGLQQFLPIAEAATLSRSLVEHPWFQAGRSGMSSAL